MEMLKGERPPREFIATLSAPSHAPSIHGMAQRGGQSRSSGKQHPLGWVFSMPVPPPPTTPLSPSPGAPAPDVLMFETEDLVLRKNEKNFVLCLLELARRAARFGMRAPTLVQMEEEIEEELRQELHLPPNDTPLPRPPREPRDLRNLDQMVGWGGDGGDGDEGGWDGDGGDDGDGDGDDGNDGDDGDDRDGDNGDGMMGMMEMIGMGIIGTG